MSGASEDKAKIGGIFGRFKNATQSISKIWSKHERTRDPELEARIEQACCRIEVFKEVELVEDVRKRYHDINKTLQTIVTQYASLGKHHALLASQLDELALKEEELRDPISRTAELQDTLGMRTDPLAASLKPVTHGIALLCDKTIGDSLQSVRQWQHALNEFDTLRAELESPGISPTAEQEAHLVELKHRLDKARESVWVKMDLLHEHRMLVVNQYMALLHDAFRQFYSLEPSGSQPEAATEAVHVPGWSPRPVFNQQPKKPQRTSESDAPEAAKPDGEELKPDAGVERTDDTIGALEAVTLKDKKALKKRVSFNSEPNKIIDAPSAASLSDEDDEVKCNSTA